MKKWIVGAVFGLVAGGLSAATPVERLKQLQGNPAGKAAAVAAGRQAATFCFNCHGEDGNSKLADVPNLADQSEFYLAEQIRRFSVGERKNDFMQGLMKVLSDDDRVNIALYFASQKVKSAGGSAAAPDASGKATYQRVCSPCHGPNGQGTELIPHLGGQQRDYLIKSLQRYRDKTGERREKAMADVTAKLTDAEIRQLAAFLGALR